jgi:hypothetical protein
MVEGESITLLELSSTGQHSTAKPQKHQQSIITTTNDRHIDTAAPMQQVP